MSRRLSIGDFKAGAGCPLFLIAGPCVIEGRQACLKLAGRLADLARREKVPLIFKASYDKANRSSGESFRGPGLLDGLEILQEIKEKYGLPILTDIHSEVEVDTAADVADVLQIPAFLCRQTDLLVAAGETGRIVNVKKGQFLAPADVRHIVAKIEATGNRKLMLTERGVCFGYNNLVADMRSLPIMRALGYPVVFDATHSVQRPGAGENGTGGDACWAPVLARAAVAAGCDGIFVETHLRPREALSDRDNCLAFARLATLWRTLTAIHKLTEGGGA
jgi:2-dehydro-3-deoxyphosphooctonate aldolase (KDO 8-P synthase)